MMTPKGASPVPLRVAVGDHITGISTASGILAALLKARDTGQGTLVEGSLVRSGAYVVGSDFSTYMRYGRIARSRPREEAVVPSSNFFKTADDLWLFLNSRPGEPDWPEMVRALELEHIEGDERFSSFRARRKNGPALVKIMDEAFAKRSLAEWGQRLDAEGIIWSPVQSFAQALEDPQMEAAGVFVDMPKADGSSYKAPASPIRFSDTNTDPKGPSPEIGEHTLAVLQDLGVDKATCSALLENKIIRQHEG